MIRKHLLISGMVQGVGFRYRALYISNNLGITGWVQNLWDGRVEMEVQGSQEAITALLEKLKTARFISIDNIEAVTIPVVHENSFDIKY